MRYEELNEDKTRALITQYNKEAADAGYGPSAPNKRPRTWDNNRPSRFTDRTDRVPERGGSGGSGGGRYGGGNLKKSKVS